MIRNLAVIITFFLCTSCNINVKKENVDEEPLMYQPTEMALLMRKMYEVNNVVKKQIINKDAILPFPEEFSNIHTAVLTDPSERNSEFDSLANLYLNYQKDLFNTGNDSTVYYFNKSVNTCITCHETRCVGPLPKIKKLLIR
ncbi:MAG: hypothetical protein WBN17_05395 [Aureibaculum sp.]